MKILILDIETAPHIAYIWGLWKENIPLDRLIESGYVLCWSAKWYGTTAVEFSSLAHESKGKMIKRIHKLMDEADVIVTYNGKKFDIPHLNREFINQGLNPPSPYKQVDLYETAKRRFKFPSNKLQYVAQFLGIGEKAQTGGFDLWIRCMTSLKDREAWETMMKYNIQDVELTESVYTILKPWVTKHPNAALFSDGSKAVCTSCGSEHLQKRGVYHTLASVFQRYQCQDCGSWTRDNTPLKGKQFKTRGIE